MGKYQDDISRMSKKDLERALRDAREEQRKAYKRGYDDGWRAKNIEHREYVEPMNHSFNTLWGAMMYTFGAASVGFGEITLATLKKLGGQIADAATRLEFDVSRVEERTGEAMGLDLSDAIAVKDALKVMYDGTDPHGNQLRAIAANINPTIAQNILEIRPLYAPGRETKDVIDRLCARAKPFRDSGKNWEETYSALEAELYGLKNPTPDEQEEIDHMANGSLQSLNRAYNRRQNLIKLPKMGIGT